MRDEQTIQARFSGNLLNYIAWQGILSVSWRNEMLVVMIVGAVIVALLLEGTLVAFDRIDI